MRWIVAFFLIVSTNAFAQNEFLAKEYFKNGNFEKALYEYKKLYAKSPSNITYIKQIVDSHQQLKQYNEAEVFLLKMLEKTNYSAFYVDLGYNFQLKGEVEKANTHYALAISSLLKNANNAYTVARSFQQYALLDQAIITYEKAMALKPKLNFTLPLAQIYGEQGKLNKMMLNYVNFIEKNPSAISNIKRTISDFILEDAQNEGNVILRKLLIKKIQQQPDIVWNEMLSWLFIQQKDYTKAFTQQKAIFLRQPERLVDIIDLGRIANSEDKINDAITIFKYVVDKAQDTDTRLIAYYDLLQIEVKTTKAEDYKVLQSKFLDLFNTYGKYAQTFKLQIAYAHFLAFYMNETNTATTFLEDTLKLPLTKLEQAEVKLELGDILVLQEAFSKALIYYSQIQRNLKNSTISQQARFKVAKASYYKGDFKWAESQLKILKSSTSQLIANDALDLKLLITDNKYEDSLQTGLRLYAKADLLSFQNRNDEAIEVLSSIIKSHKAEPIIPQALFKQGALFEMKQQFEKAEDNYQYIIKNYSDGILMDNALYNLANLYAGVLNKPNEAKALYKQIVFNHADSIFFVDARKKFRTLRGDALN